MAGEKRVSSRSPKYAVGAVIILSSLNPFGIQKGATCQDLVPEESSLLASLDRFVRQLLERDLGVYIAFIESSLLSHSSCNCSWRSPSNGILQF